MEMHSQQYTQVGLATTNLPVHMLTAILPCLKLFLDSNVELSSSVCESFLGCVAFNEDQYFLH